ncbi:DUF1206 domain-containing protein [Skermanella mucosa]|uniref:DUF1206 domain-containing protein n=1 Tax=Skermanella mucosa TaxID=1789672 RepID=UPI00192BB998|nr:DUF1206 domain-containing protein [Skermanella mucosa]UEM19103.1 DUF1206 domain-containing protein [Skermanella mucosa]
MGNVCRFESLARLGYGARGVVYVLVGWFAMMAALGAGQLTDTKGVLREILLQPFGKALLAVVALGLVGHAVWRIAQAWLDLDGHGADAKGIVVRGGLLASGAIHVSLAFFAISLVLGLQGPGSGDSGDGARDWTAWLLSQPFGRWLVGAVGVAVLGAAAGHFVKAWKATFRRFLKADPRTMEMICPIGRVGLGAKGVVFLIIGVFFLTAAWQVDSSESGGLGKALEMLQEQPYGAWVLGVVAVGLFAFGIYSMIVGFYRRIDYPSVLPGLKAPA